MVDRLADDFALWAQECFRISDKRKEDRPLVLNGVQRAIESAEREELRKRGRARLYVLKGRQSGVTTYQQAKSLHTIWARPRAVALTLAHKREATDKIFEQITQYAVRNFPPELLPSMGGRETREISFSALESHFYTETAGTGGGAGRSMTLTRAHLSEFAFYPSPADVMKAITPALEAPGTVCVIETTAEAYDGEAHKFWKANKAGEGEYRCLFFPWWECDPVTYRTPLLTPNELGDLDDEEHGLVTRHGLTLEQLKWRRQMIVTLGSEDAFRQEYPDDDETCWLTSGSLFFNAETLRVLKQRTPAPIEVAENGDLLIYGHLRDGETAIMGVDTAEGGGGDATTWTARAYPSWRLLSRYKSATIEPVPFAKIADRWGRRYGYALLVIEKNMHGITVLRELRDDLHYPLSAIYHRHTHDKSNSGEEQLGKIGWATTGESQPLLLDAIRELLQAAKEKYADVPSEDALNDALGVRRDDKGKVKLTGKDTIVSEALAWIGRDTPRSRVLVA